MRERNEAADECERDARDFEESQALPEHTCGDPTAGGCAACDLEEWAEDLPGESRYAGDYGEPEEWDVVGGL
jgi:hypothetical protein